MTLLILLFTIKLLVQLNIFKDNETAFDFLSFVLKRFGFGKDLIKSIEILSTDQFSCAANG